VPDAGTSSNVNLGKEPLLGNESNSSKEAPPDGSDFRDENDDDEDVSKYVHASRKRLPRQRYRTKRPVGRGHPSFSGLIIYV
jgi:hypothetical protein